jgi:oxalate decarboxylase/phosphoglucose isomerase-like protein (cupin superfamily)
VEFFARVQCKNGAFPRRMVRPPVGVSSVGRRRVPLAPGTLLLVEQRERHEIRNTGRTALRTLNFYVPPAYTRSGDPRPRGRK